MKGTSITAVLAIVLIIAVAIFAGNTGDKGQKDAQQQAIKAQHKTVTGTMVCMGCELKHGEGARAACADFGHQHAIKTEDGKYISLLENKYSKELMGEKHHNKAVTVHGVLYPRANILDVESFQVDGHKKSWCEGHKNMDACSTK